MSTANWNKIKEIFVEAIELDAAARARFLDKKCGGDARLRREVEDLLCADEEAESLMSRPAVEKQPADFFAGLSIGADPLIGKKIGAYRLTAEIGRGGMGAVYLAERADGEFRRQVAVKLVKRGMDSDFILKRFRRERQMLAALEHPFIARLLDGGATDDNLPFFVMEYVEGSPLYKYCDDRKLSIRARLELFRQICAAVEYAHERRIVHRDLKPSNVLIKPDGTPKLLDFGIAKAFDPEIGVSFIDPTQTAMRMMTPEYASPEQISGLPVTFSSDIYSLGVVLYELLTGTRPYRFKSRAPFEIARVVCEEEPVRPSESLRRSDARQGRMGEKLFDEPEVVSPAPRLLFSPSELEGEIERVMLKCLRKNPQERYETAAALDADLARCLKGEKVAAEAFFAPSTLEQRATTEANETDNPITADAEKSIAVLPLKLFAAPNDSSGDRYLGVGLADAIITRLSNVGRFSVRPTSAILRFGDSADAIEAGRALQVDYVLSGTIRRAGDRVRVSVQLLETKTNAALWAENFNENLTDVLELEDTVAEKTARVLIPKLTGEEQQKLHKRGTDSPAADESYRRARFHLYQISPAEFAKAKTYFEQAIRLDPNFALAYVGLGEYYFSLATFSPVPPRDCYEKIKEMATRALEIDDSLGEAYALLGFSRFVDFDWEDVEINLHMSVELNAHYPLARMWRAALFTFQGRSREAVREAERAVELNPLGAFESAHLAFILYQNRHFREAERVARKMILDNPTFSLGHSVLGCLLTQLGEREEAVEAMRRAFDLSGGNPWMTVNSALVYAKIGEMEKARALLRGLDQQPFLRDVLAWNLALVHLNLGETEQAFAELEKAVALRNSSLIWINSEPELDPFRGDERFRRLERRVDRRRSAGETGER